MSRGQRARTPANFPRMRYRAWSRHWRQRYTNGATLGTIDGAPWLLPTPCMFQLRAFEVWHNPLLPPVALPPDRPQLVLPPL